MNRSLPHIFSMLKVVPLVALMLLVNGCINDNDTCLTAGESTDSELMTLSFQVISNNISSSRAGTDCEHDEDASEWPEFEDVISESNLAFYIFAQNPDGQWVSVMTMTNLPADKGQNAFMTVNGASGIWMITASIPKQEFEQKIGYSVERNPSQKIPFRVVVLANAVDSEVGTGSFSYEWLVRDTFDAFLTRCERVFFNLNKIHSDSNQASQVNGIYKGAIPMYGMNDFEVAGDELYYSDRQNPAWMGHVDLLRAMAKIRVMDNIENKDPDGYPRISDAYITSATARVNILPYEAKNFKGQQVDYPNISTTMYASRSSSGVPIPVSLPSRPRMRKSDR